MSSYNFLKALGDGLAEAIRYRTNLKRQRRENEYNYNRDWQRNENEYQRDLGRKRDELDYMTDYNWKQEQRAYDRGVERKNQEREANKARILDFVDTYNPANVNRHDWADVQNFNTNAIANDIPLAIKYEDLENLNKSLQDKMAVLKQQHDYKMAEIAANRMGRGGSVRQPSLTPYEKLQRDLSMAKTPEEREMVLQLHRVGSRAVKGGSGNGVVMEQPLDPNLDMKTLFNIKQAANKAYLDFINHSSGKAPSYEDYLAKRTEIQDNDKLTEEQKQTMLKAMEEAYERDINRSDKQTKDLYMAYKNLDKQLQDATQRAYPGWSHSREKGYFRIDEAKLAASQKAQKRIATLNQEHDDLIGLDNKNRGVVSPVDTPPKAVMPYPPTILPDIKTPEDTPKTLAEKYFNYELNILNQNRASMTNEQYLSELRKLNQKYGRR